MVFKKLHFDLFDLRIPHGFAFLSIPGFIIYAINFVAITNTNELFSTSCLKGFPNLDGCGVDAWVIIFQAVFFLFAFLVAAAFRKPDWAIDALFNATSIVILTTSIFTLLLSFTNSEIVAGISRNYRTYYLLAVAVVLSSNWLLVWLLRGRPIGRSLLRLGKDEIRLLGGYYLLAASYLISAVYVSIELLP
nr:hypothetical protein [uncultured Cohaesibacter sp.]